MPSEYVYPHHVFISYSSHDKPIMQELTGYLNDLGIHVWSDEHLTPGTPSWRQAIAEAIENAGCMIVILSPDSKQSKWVVEELSYAEIMEVPVYPVLMRGEPRSSVPFGLATVQYVDLRDMNNYVGELLSLAAAIEAHLRSLAETPAPHESAHYGYPNRWGLVFIRSLESTIGAEQAQRILGQAGIDPHPENIYPDTMKRDFPFEKASAITQAMLDANDRETFRRVMNQVGRSSFTGGLSSFASSAQIIRRVLQLAPREARPRLFLHAFSRWFNQVSDQRNEVREDDEHWHWVITRCPLCWGLQADHPVCDVVTGNIQGALEWAFEGETFAVEEIACAAEGSPECVFAIPKIT